MSFLGFTQNLDRLPSLVWVRDPLFDAVGSGSKFQFFEV